MEQLLERYEQEAKQMTVMLPRERAENMLGNIEQLQAKLQQAKNDIQNLTQEKLALTRENADHQAKLQQAKNKIKDLKQEKLALTRENKKQKRQLGQMQTGMVDLSLIPNKEDPTLPPPASTSGSRILRNRNGQKN